MKKDALKSVSIYVLFSISVLFFLSYGMSFFLEDSSIMKSFDVFDLLLAQTSNTFIVLSLTSVLSTNIGTIYWEDVKDIKLVSPFWYCFLALTIYLLSALVFAFVCFTMNFDCGVCASFLVSIILLIFLTYRMIGVYFGEAEIRRDLKWKYQLSMLDSEYSYYQFEKKLERIRMSVDRDEKDKHKQIERRYQRFLAIEPKDFALSVDENEIARYKTYKEKLKEKTIQALNNSDFGVVEENLNLLVEVQDAAAYIDILDAIIPVDSDYASSLLLKVKNKFDMAYSIQISELAKNILHNLATGNYSLNTIKKLVWTISGDSICVENYKELLKELKQLEQEYRMNADVLPDDDFLKVCREQRKQTKKYEDILLECLSRRQQCVLGENYKPIYELYDAYVKRDLNLMMIYLEIIREDIESIKAEIRLIIGEICPNHEMVYLSKEQNEVIDMIIDSEEQRRFLPKRIMKEIQDIRRVL